MCGIIGTIKGNRTFVEEGLLLMKNRGLDGFSIESRGEIILGHNLHSIVNYVPQPLFDGDFLFSVNCEIYNWIELSDKYKINARNDAELMFKLLIKYGLKLLDELDGVYAFCLYDIKNDKLILGRDIIGIKPLFYAEENGCFYFASEKKALINFGTPVELSPRKIIEYYTTENKIEIINRQFFSILPEHNESYEDLKKLVFTLLEKAIMKRVPKVKFGLLFSGGIDSTIIAYILKKNKVDFVCYTAAFKGFTEDARDLIYAREVAEKLNLKLKETIIEIDEIEQEIPKIVSLIESNNVVKVGVALPFYFSSIHANKDNCKVIFSGLGSEEIFAGYDRHAMSAGIKQHGVNTSISDDFSLKNINKECLSGLLEMHERDLYRDDVITMYNKIELRLPFLDKELVSYSLKIPPKYKISKEEKKIILRDIAEDIGIDYKFARRPKQAAQYGSKFDKALLKISKKNKFNSKSEYLNQFSKFPNLRLASLLSTGKDSIYATQVMMRQNYEISCFCTIQSENKDSYMFHTPTIDVAKYQAQSCGIPLLIGLTKGEKEDELEDLKSLLLCAKEKYKIDGVVTGALFSTYQRDRVQKICQELGLVCKNPLWHKNQEEYMYELIKNGYIFIFSKVMSEGLDDSFVGKIIDVNDILRLKQINDSVGINMAGEGGEFETLVLDCPIFNKALDIKFEKKHDPDRRDTVWIEISSINLVSK